jgi:N-acetylglucosaminyldiphosphoundecaprenol N-acetyl-beta-D-mannosaminyltransferase
MTQPFPTVTILGVPIHQLSMAETVTAVAKMMGESEPRLHQIATVNPEFIMRAQQDEPFRTVLRHADLCLADGIGVVWAARYQGQPVPERVPGSELVHHLAAEAAQAGWSLFLLGAAPGIAAQAAIILQQRYPSLIIAGTYAGSPAPAENEAIVALINESGAQMLWVAYGAPKQDLWIARNRDKLPLVRVAVGVGGSLDFITGKAIRAPRWVQNLGLEWLHRLWHEPWRWRRMLALPRFVLWVLFKPKA